MPFGDKLREILEEKGITQKEFAAILNISPSTLNGYIKNNRQPDFDLVRKIAFILNVSVDCLFDYTCENAVTSLSVKELSLISKLRELDKSQQSIIYDLVNIASKKHSASQK